MLLVSPIAGLALGATVTLLRGRLPRWITPAGIAVFAFGPLALISRTELGHTTGRALWEWSAVGGATVQASYHIDPLAVIAAAVIAVSTGVGVSSAARSAGAFPAAFLAILGMVLVAFVAVTDAVIASMVAGAAAALAVAVALFVAPQDVAARLGAFLALGLQAFIAAALLLARAGVASFELNDISPGAISPSVVVAVFVGAALFAGLYPFVPWRYESANVETTSNDAVRGLALFPIGVAATLFAWRFIGASGSRPDQMLLPSLPIEWQAALLALVIALAAIAVRAGPTEARLRRTIGGAIFVVAVSALPLLDIAYAMALLALLTVVYATVASAARVAEWGVARFDVRLAVLWAALASGSAPALAAALFGSVASSVALIVEPLEIAGVSGVAIATSARLLNAIGPFLALAGVAFATDPIAEGLSAIVLAWAAVLELAHAVRETGTDRNLRAADRAFAALVAVAVVFAVALVAAVPATAAAVDVLGPLPAEASDLVLAALALLSVALAVVLVALPGTIAMPFNARVLSLFRRIVAASDPVPALALAYRAIEAWSERIGASFAVFEDRAGVWLATALIALALIWAATS